MSSSPPPGLGRYTATTHNGPPFVTNAYKQHWVVGAALPCARLSSRLTNDIGVFFSFVSLGPSAPRARTMSAQAADCEGAAASSDMPQTAQSVPTFDTVLLDTWTAAALNKKDKYGAPIVFLNGPVQGKPPVVDLFRKTDA